jgi:hypothetical protein
MNWSSFRRTILLDSMLCLPITLALCSAREAHPCTGAMRSRNNAESSTPLIPYALWGARRTPLMRRMPPPVILRVLKIDYLDVPLNIIDNGHAAEERGRKK